MNRRTITVGIIASPSITGFLVMSPSKLTISGPQSVAILAGILSFFKGITLSLFARLIISGIALIVIFRDARATSDLSESQLQQLKRFFAVIELADQPFIPQQGPADFGADIKSATNVFIMNGTIGRSAHHGIHGNGNRFVTIWNVHFKDFEVAAVALNGVEGLWIQNSTATNRKDVPVLGTFSSAQFIKAYIEFLVQTNSSTVLHVGGTALTATDIRGALRDAINNVHEDLIILGKPSIDEVTHPDEYALFHNRFGIIDGNSYGYLVNGLGVAVNGFPRRPDYIETFPYRLWGRHGARV